MQHVRQQIATDPLFFCLYLYTIMLECAPPAQAKAEKEQLCVLIEGIRVIGQKALRDRKLPELPDYIARCDVKTTRRARSGLFAKFDKASSKAPLQTSEAFHLSMLVG
jgi:hypothetical protein